MSSGDLDLLSAWHFDLPPDLIASRPPQRREDARLLVVSRRTGHLSHSRVSELPRLLHAPDLLVLNNTRVLPARLFGFRTATGGRWEGLFLSQPQPGIWHLLCETRGRLQPGEHVTVLPTPQVSTTRGTAVVGDGGDRAARGDSSNLRQQLLITLLERTDDGGWLGRVDDPREPTDILQDYGHIPLPPYMGRRIADADDQIRYQTTFASEPGAVAAPTAGLHFTEQLLSECRRSGIHSCHITLHVGIGTFRPVSTERLSDHPMHAEWCAIGDAAVQAIRATRETGGRTIAVGTTSVRTLESACHATQPSLAPWQGSTRLFIRPGYEFGVTDGLLTNFHLPGSTLLVLVAAFCGYETMQRAYQEAIAHRYRFYSYGDAMLIL